MDPIQRDELRALIRSGGERTVSIYMPTHRGGVDARQAPVQLKNLLREAQNQLEAVGSSKALVEKLLRPGQDLVSDPTFWVNQDLGLAVLLGENGHRAYRLPYTVPTLAVAGRFFHIKPLEPMLEWNGHFYVLALSQKMARLFQGTRTTLRELRETELPGPIKEALESFPGETTLQVHSAGTGHGGMKPGVFHGHGGLEEDHKSAMEKYFRLIDGVLKDSLTKEKSPLVLAAVDYLYPIYAKVNSFAGLEQDWIPGNPDQATEAELHTKALPIVEATFTKAKKRAAARFEEMEAAGKGTSKLREALKAASAGRVESIFVPIGIHVWGQFNPADGTMSAAVTRSAGDEDLLNLVALDTFLHGGTVYAVSPEAVPGGGEVAAEFRY